MKMGFSEENWDQVLSSLGFTEQRNPNGMNCWDVHNNKGVPTWQYDSDEEQEKLYYFFSGMVYQKIVDRYSGR